MSRFLSVLFASGLGIGLGMGVPRGETNALLVGPAVKPTPLLSRKSKLKRQRDNASKRRNKKR